MPSKIWSFEINGNTHVVELEYSLVSSRERFLVDETLLSDEHRWVLVSRYMFTIEGHPCEAVLSFGLTGWKGNMTVDGKLVQLLPCKTLLRPAFAPGSNSEVLVRPSFAQETTLAEELLRADVQENS